MVRLHIFRANDEKSKSLVLAIEFFELCEARRVKESCRRGILACGPAEVRLAVSIGRLWNDCLLIVPQISIKAWPSSNAPFHPATRLERNSKSNERNRVSASQADLRRVYA